MIPAKIKLMEIIRIAQIKYSLDCPALHSVANALGNTSVIMIPKIISAAVYRLALRHISFFRKGNQIYRIAEEEQEEQARRAGVDYTP